MYVIIHQVDQKKGMMMTQKEQIFDIAMALVIKSLISGVEDKERVYETVYNELEQMGFELDAIESALEDVFSLEEFSDGSLFPFGGLSHIVFDLYAPEKRVPLELLMGIEDNELRGLFKELYTGRISSERFELSLESGEKPETAFEGYN